MINASVAGPMLRASRCHRGKRVAAHARRYGGMRHGTQTEHMPSAHRRYAERTPERLRSPRTAVGGSRRGGASRGCSLRTIGADPPPVSRTPLIRSLRAEKVFAT